MVDAIGAIRAAFLHENTEVEDFKKADNVADRKTTSTSEDNYVAGLALPGDEDRTTPPVVDVEIVNYSADYDGKLTCEKKQTVHDGKDCIARYYYTEDGELIRTVYKYKDGSKDVLTSKKLDDGTILTSTVSYFHDGEFKKQKLGEYKDGVYTSTTTNRYGIEIEKTTSTYKDGVNHTVTESYDIYEGYLTKKVETTTKRTNSGKIKTITITTKYDKNGNVISEKKDVEKHNDTPPGYAGTISFENFFNNMKDAGERIADFFGNLFG